MATLATLSKSRIHAAGSFRRNPELLPHQSTLRSGGSHQRQHQNPSSKGSWLQKPRLPVAQGPTHGGHQDRIHRSSESSLKCGSLRILVQSRIFGGSAGQNLTRGPRSIAFTTNDGTRLARW